MNNNRINLTNLSKYLLLLTTLISSYSLLAQPSWPPTAPSTLENTIGVGSSISYVNCDMYTDMETGSPTDQATAVVWEEDGDVWLWVEDHGTATTVYNGVIVADAGRPDVIIGDDGSSTSGSLIVGIVYQDNNNDIFYIELPLSNMCNPSSGVPPSAGTSTTPTQINSSSYQGDLPKIDAFPQPTVGNYWGVGNPYEPLTEFVISWTEYNTSAPADEIWVNSGTLGSGVTGTATYIDDGLVSDIAGVFIDDLMGNTNEIAYIVYTNGTSFLKLAEYDISSNTVSSTSNLETSVIVAKQPRIEAMNVQNPNTPNTRWVAVAQIFDGTSNNEIRSYNPSGTYFFDNYAPFTRPISADGFNPCVAVGPGPDDYNGLTGEYGNNYYLELFTIDAGELESVDYDGTSYGGYYEVCSLTFNDVTYFTAATSSSNCGYGHFTVWGNDVSGSYQIAWKLNTGTSTAFKPTKTGVITKGDMSVFPNPANNYIHINKLNKDALYTITDIAGKVVIEGMVSKQQSTIGVTDLHNGIYILNIDDGESLSTHKIIKH